MQTFEIYTPEQRSQLYRCFWCSSEVRLNHERPGCGHTPTKAVEDHTLADLAGMAHDKGIELNVQFVPIETKQDNTALAAGDPE